MRRYALRDDQWERIGTFCPAVPGMSALLPRTIDCLSRRCFTGIAQASPGGTCRNASATR